MEQEAESYEPVNQLYTAKTRADGAASKWQVDTSDIRKFLDEKLKGYVRLEIEYYEFEILDKDKNPVSRFFAKTDEEAIKQLNRICEARGFDVKDYELKATQEKEWKEVLTRDRTPLLPDDIVDAILIPIETTFSHIGYLTKYTLEEIKDEVYRNIVAIRLLLANKALERHDIKIENLESAINLIKNIMYQILRASQDGWTGNRMSEITTEKIITGVEKRGLMSL